MIESYTPIPPLTTPKSTAAPKLYILYSLLTCIPFYSLLFASIWSQDNHQSVRLYFILWSLALVVTVLLDYLAIVHIWRTDSSPRRTNLLFMAWLLHSGAGYQSLMKLGFWALDEVEASLGVVIAVCVVTGLAWMAVGMGGIFVILRRDQLRERLAQRRMMIGI